MGEQRNDRLNSVIVVDRDRILLHSLKRELSSKGYACEVAENADTAQRFIKEKSFDVLIAGVYNSSSEIFEFIKKTRKLRSRMAVIIMTESINEPFYKRAIAHGASDFILKPINHSEVTLRLSHAMLNEKLRQMSITDELTGLYNRRGFFTLAEHQLKMANRANKGMYLLFADVDKLKVLNDTFGHREGDIALMETAETLRNTFRQSDIIARISGDEFVVFPITTEGTDIDRIVGRFYRNLQIYNCKKGGRCLLSLSTGVSYYDPMHPLSIYELLIKADRSMYEKKKRGSISHTLNEKNLYKAYSED